MRVVLVPGTWGWRGKPAEGDWWWPTSPLARHLERRGHEIVGKSRPFVWSTDLEGLHGDHADWRAGGENLFAYAVPALCPDRRIKPDELAVVSHSHGGQVALYAAAFGLQIAVLVTVSTPVRADMDGVIDAARPHIGHWLHVHSDRTDWMQVWGALLDGRLGIRRAMPRADVNLMIPEAGHSAVLHDAAYEPYWNVISDTLERGYAGAA